ncbi:MAG: hypothetical protein WBP59_01290, partial [Ilumatobacteraceae bacterium]
LPVPVPGLPAPAPTPAPSSPAPTGVLAAAVDVDLGVDARVGNIGTRDILGVDASDVTAGIDLVVDPQRLAETPQSSGELLTATVSDLHCGVDRLLDPATHVRCAATAAAGVDIGLVTLGVNADICNVSVAILDAAQHRACDGNVGDDPTDDPSDDPADDPTDDPAADPTGGDDRADTDGGSTDVNGFATPKTDASEGSGLPVTGTPAMLLLAIAAGLTTAGAAALAVKRREL